MKHLCKKCYKAICRLSRSDMEVLTFHMIWETCSVCGKNAIHNVEELILAKKLADAIHNLYPGTIVTISRGTEFFIEDK